ncbi:hypothetical protein PR003_g29286 [Phytophthora rubi]|uniref:PX domain-containing protein n=1 Tax=Phytophthora rubi TaxID=129364 RepID=A0A6A4BMY9_9STRA|nr:hypothetical protein PR003_g29286 [Phytophthora rubi]
MADPIFSRGEQLEAVVDRLPDWYFAATQVLHAASADQTAAARPVHGVPVHGVVVGWLHGPRALGLLHAGPREEGHTYIIRRGYSDFEDLHNQLTEILENRQAYYRSKALSRLARGVAPVPADARTQEDKLERAITAFALLPTLRQRF